MKRVALLSILTVFALGFGQAQTSESPRAYVGATLASLSGARTLFGVQVGTDVSQRVSLRGHASTDLDAYLFGADLLLDILPDEAAWRPYFGGGLTFAWVQGFEGAEILLPLPGGVAGLEYRAGSLGMFGEAKLYLTTLAPFLLPELKAGVNLHF